MSLLSISALHRRAAWRATSLHAAALLSPASGAAPAQARGPEPADPAAACGARRRRFDDTATTRRRPFADWRVVRYEERRWSSDRSPNPDRITVRLVAQKP